MQSNIPPFSNLQASRPTLEGLSPIFSRIEKEFTDAQSPEATRQAIESWNEHRKSIDTWKSITHLNFSQDTQNEAYKSERDYADELSPKLIDFDVRIKKLLLASPHREALTKEFGPQAFALWGADVTTFEPSIEDNLVKEAKLSAEYVELLASAKIDIDGNIVNLSGVAPYATHADRDTRYRAEQARWKFFSDNGEKLDEIFHELTQLRHTMATKLGFENYIGMGYQRMQRVDYKSEDVALFRKQVLEDVVPLAADLRKSQAARLGVDSLMYWDEAAYDLSGNPKPQGDEAWMIQRAREMFDDMGEEIGSFFNMMADQGYLDLDTRAGKAGGGFCTSFADYGVPFVFANFNGTKHDVEVFTHEIGHAFQNWRSRNKPIVDYLWPTYESCEIHSMSLEFLTWPFMELFFKDDAERFRRVHLTESLIFLPYGVAVDEFQHLVYANPSASPDERGEMWREVEQRYMPWRQYGDLSYPASGRRWQLQRHIYGMPFYYIDYTLAQTCALQFWVQANTDRRDAMERYINLCTRGGEAPFQELAQSAGVISPLREGCLKDVVKKAREFLD